MSYVATQPYRQFNGWRPPSPRRASGAGEYRRCRRGMGDARTEAAAVQQIGSIASPAVTGIIAAHAASVAAATVAQASILGMSLSTAVPVIGAALVGATLLASYLIRNSGCGQTCIVTSQWADQAEAMLKQNLAAYLALPVPRPASAQAVALANFDAVWKTLQQQCGQSGTGDAGKRCISDRQAGACKWRDSAGACFNWFSGYRDPIANDADVVDDSAVAQLSSAVSSVLPGGSSASLVPLVLIAALVIVGVML
jgi:hypothetical protein